MSHTQCGLHLEAWFDVASRSGLLSHTVMPAAATAAAAAPAAAAPAAAAPAAAAPRSFFSCCPGDTARPGKCHNPGPEESRSTITSWILFSNPKSLQTQPENSPHKHA
jgi:hypothetical protein